MLEVAGASKDLRRHPRGPNASLHVGAGEIHALIGPNGAGKTTLFNLISGLFPTDNGTIRLNGREIQGVSSDASAVRGWRVRSRSPICSAAFRSTRTCGYRCRRAADAVQSLARHRQLPEIHAETAELINFRGLEGIEQSKAANCPTAGSGRSISASRSVSKPQVLLLDEPLAGLAAAERERVSNLIKTSPSTFRS